MTALEITAALFGWVALAAVLAPVVGRRLRGRDEQPVRPYRCDPVVIAACLRRDLWDEDFAKWSRSFHPSLRDFDPREAS